MNNKTLLAAETEAKEFLRRVKELRADDPSMEWNEYRALYGSKYSAAVKRQSMELTRALASMRRIN